MPVDALPRKKWPTEDAVEGTSSAARRHRPIYAKGS
jgi:hypothetical protein